MKKKNIKNFSTFDELLDIKYGKVGSPKRDKFEKNAKNFIINEVIIVKSYKLRV